MAFQSKDLSVLAYANGFTLWHYASADTAATIAAAGYFNRAAEMINPGDLMIVTSATGTAPTTALARVSAVANGVVSTAAL
ncbi:hypothetical protein [Caenispirillum bisanense]|uniref:hypothetical protein n=1 Tax=Caenispirillum bisanense TaxID=414052 RepID=UPI0031DAFC34